MRQYIEFLAKLIAVLLAAGAAMAILTGSLWGLCGGTFLLAAGYIICKRTGRLLRHMRLQRRIADMTVKRVTEDGFTYRDLNHNGILDIYEDPWQPIEARVEDLLRQMTIEEKAGLLFSPQMDVVDGDKVARKGGILYGGDAVYQMEKRKINAFCAMGSLPPKEFARWANGLQKAAEMTRLGIPVTISSDPRNVYGKDADFMTVQKGDGLSQWPCALGFGAAGGEKMAEEFGRLTAKELRAVGIHLCIAPVADTATEPRWPRITETYGEDAEKNGKLAAALVRGMQGSSLTKDSVACCIKHFPGGGPQKDGDDPHFAFGKEQVYPGGNFDYHLKAFLPALKENVSCVMPYYGMPVGLDGIEEVGFNYNLQITRELLREKLGYEGIVYTDYTVVEGLKLAGLTFMKGRAWGLEYLNTNQRLKRIMEATADFIGGECCSKRLAKLVERGMISEERLNVSCRKLLTMKFALGLFDDPYVDADGAEALCGTREAVKAGENAMRRSVVMLKKDGLPLQKNCRVYLEGLPAECCEGLAQIAETPEEADASILWLDAPHYPDDRDFMTNMMQGGSLEYTDEVKNRIKELAAMTTLIVIVRMTRPAVIDWLTEQADGIVAEFNVKPKILMEVVFGVFSPTGRLPFSLPGSAEEVAKQRSDVPFDYEKTTYDYGYGLGFDDESGPGDSSGFDDGSGYKDTEGVCYG